MSDEMRFNRPSQPSGQRMEGSGMQQPMQPENGSSSSKTPWIILGLVVVVLIVLGVVFRDKLFSGNSQKNTTTTAVKSSGYQAVFLTNGQVYFGKISNPSADYADLSDIYYLQVVQQPPLQGTPQQQQQQAAQPQISLIKLGNELHGPVDQMKISKSQILFYEDLKDDSKVVQAIRDYKANPPK